MSPTSAAFAAAPLVNPDGSRKYSVIITASDSTCGGCDDGPADISAITARKSAIAAGVLSFSGLNSCSITPFPVPAANAACVASKSFCDGALVSISGTGRLSGPLGNGPVQFALTVTDDDTGVSATDNNVVDLTIQLPRGPYVTGWHCHPPTGTEAPGCGVEVTGHG